MSEQPQTLQQLSPLAVMSKGTISKVDGATATVKLEQDVEVTASQMFTYLGTLKKALIDKETEVSRLKTEIEQAEKCLKETFNA